MHSSEIPKVFPNWRRHFTSHCSLWVFQFLYFLIKNLLLSFFLKAILVSLKWYLIVVWACISVKTNGLPRWCSDKESACQCRRWKRCGFDPWVRKIPWSRKCQPAPVFLPGKFHGQRSLTGCSAWGHKELDMTWAHAVHTILMMLSFFPFTFCPFVYMYLFLKNVFSGPLPLSSCLCWGPYPASEPFTLTLPHLAYRQILGPLLYVSVIHF